MPKMPLDLRAMHDAPRDGTPILIRFEHENYKYAIGPDKERWEELCIATWIDFNGGAGHARHLRPGDRMEAARHWRVRGYQNGGFYHLRVPEYA